MSIRHPELLFTALAFALLPQVAHAAETATLTGIVRDPQDAAVAGADVTIREQSTGAERRASTNSTGLFTAPSLQPGEYSITILAAGFKTLESTHLLLGVAENRQVDFTLEVGDVSQAISVETSSPLINFSDASVGMTVGSEFVSNIPLNGRSFQQLITMAPGVNLTGGNQDAGEFSVNGQRATSNYFTVDGVSANLGLQPGSGIAVGAGYNAAGGTNSLVSVDALQEFRILTSSFAPEYGRTPGGQVILLTRSGTNDFHGTLFEYFRNDDLDANDWFANSKGDGRSPLRFNDFGGTVGGPIIKNNTFFFFSYEGQRLLQPEFGIEAVPDLASRQAAPAAVQPILNAYPIPNGPELGKGQAQFSAGYSNPINTNATSLRLDHAFGSKTTAFFRYSYAPSSSLARTTQLSDLETQSNVAHTFTAGLTNIITPRFTNEVRVNFSNNEETLRYTVDEFGGASPGPLSAVFVAPYTPENAILSVNLGFGPRLNDGKEAAARQRQINLVDGLSYTHGAHEIKVGFDYLRSLPITSADQEDLYSFALIPGALTGTANYFYNFYEATVRADATNLSLYAQDAWRSSRRLTITYGLRWDLNPPPHDRYPNNGNYIPLLGNYVDGDITVGAAGSSFWNTKYSNFAPRLGVAYQFRQVPRWETVLRVGAGLFYDVATAGATFLPLINGFPNYLTTFVSKPTLPVTPIQAALPPVSLTNPAPGNEFQVFPRDLAAPRTWQWNVSIQQGLGQDQTITASYVAALGRKLLYGQYYPSVGPQEYEVNYYDNSGVSNYQALQVQYQHRLAHGASAILNYTWSHSLDDGSLDFGYGAPTTYITAKSNWGPSDFDVRQNLSGALSWNVPGAGKVNWLKTVSQGWGVDLITTARSALPAYVASYSNNFLGGYEIQLPPDVVPGVPLYLYGSQYPGGKAFNPAAFVINLNGPGDLGRNALRGFDLVDTDFSARRKFVLTERFSLLFRADLFNLFNHPSFASPVSDPASGTFGLSTSMANSVLGGGSGYSQNSVFQTGGPRSVQLSLKLQF
jgi:hypothetical protein